MTVKNRGGRPKSYTEAQMLEGIEKVEARGDVPDGASVKVVMRDCLGVSPGIDVNILDAEVRSLCKARADEAVKKLVAKLPNSAKNAATGIGDDVARAVTAVLAVEFDQLGEESRKRETEIEIDLRIARQRNQELEAQVAQKDAATAELEEQNHALQKEGSAKDAMIAELRAEIVQNSREIDLKVQMVAILKDVIANNAGVESGGSTASQ